MFDLDTIKARVEELEKLKGETTAGDWEFEQAGNQERTLEVWGTTIYAHRRDLELTEKIIHLLWTFRPFQKTLAERTDIALTQARRDGAFIVYAHNTPIEKDLRALIAEADRARVRDARKEPPVFGQRCQVWVSGNEQWYFAYWVRPGGFEYAESGQRSMLHDCFLWLPEPDRPQP